MLKLIFYFNLLTTERLLEVATRKSAYEAVKIMSVSSRRIDLRVGEATSGRNTDIQFIKNLRQHFFEDVEAKYSKFVDCLEHIRKS